tara:strand:- start:323 stop:2392 length:2070 start_codon:yes stop_codon:yes gene_type:complete
MAKLLHIIFIFPIFLISQNWNFESFYDGSGRHHPITFSDERYGYIIAGQDGDGVYLGDVYRFDTYENSWTQLIDFPGGARGYAYGVSDENYAYVGFGSNGEGYFNDLWRFNFIDNSWLQLASLPDIGRNHPAMILTDQKIFVGLGSVDSNNLGDWWEYDIEGNSWSQKSDFTFGNRHHPFYFSINNIPYVGFGHGDYVNDNIVIYNDFYKFDSPNNSWIQLSDFPSEGRVAGTQFNYNEFGYVLSGDGDDHGPLDSGELWQYDPVDDSWTQLTSHPGGARWAPGSFVVDCKVYLTSGYEAESDIYYNDLLSFKLLQECGCTDSESFNYNQIATIDDNSCCYFSGCTNPMSFNFNENACHDDGSCIPITLGCLDESSDNYSPTANTSVAYVGPNYLNLGPGGFHYNDLWDMQFNVNELSTIKSVDIFAETNFTTTLEILDLNDIQIFSQSINLTTGWNEISINFDINIGMDYKIGIVGENLGLYRNSSVTPSTFPIDLLDVITITGNTTDSPLDYYYYFYNWQIEIKCDNNSGCTDSEACNFNPEANVDDNSCEYAVEFYDCSGNCINDLDNDNICDEEDDCIGEFDECGICNGDGPIQYYDCFGNCLIDTDNDSICDEIDNCPDVFNPNQEDFNFDNIGDACAGLNIEKHITNNFVVFSFDIIARNSNKKGFILKIISDGSVEKILKFQ